MAIKPAFAATGINQTINFQGKLVGSTGLNVADSTYSVVFTLYDASSGGTNLWDETQSVSTTDGIFQVQLGSVDTTLGNVDFNTDNLYLGIKVGADAEMTPRIRFAAVPYAFNAQKVAGLTVTNTTGTLTIPNGKTIEFADSFTTTGGNALTLATTGTTSITLPTTGTLLTNTATSNQTITSTQTSGTILGLTDSTNITGATTGLAISMTGTGAFDQTGLSFNLSGATGSNTNDIVGSGGTWKVSRSGDLTVNSCTGCTGGLANYWRLANGAFSPVNDTTDLLIGSAASASAKFGFLNVANGGTPTASISANSGNNATYLMGTGILATTNKQTLTLGQASTGNIVIGTDATARTVTIGNNTGASALAFTSGTAAQTFTSSATTGTAFSFVGNSVNTGTGLGLTANGLTNGNALSVTSTATALGSGRMLNISKTGASGSTAFTGDIANIAYSQTFNNGVGLNHTGNVMDLSRNITLNVAQTQTISGALMSLSDSATQSLGTLNSTADVLAITQNYAANTGAALNITSATNNGLIFRANDDGTLTDSTPFVIDGGGEVGIGTTAPNATLDARGILGTTPVASFSGSTAMASMVVDQSGIGDLFTASKSGATKFAVLNNGNLSMNNYNNCTMLTTIGTVLTCGSSPAASTQYVRLNNGAFSFVNDTADFLIGNTSSASAKFAFLNVNSGTPTASISANSGNNAAYFSGDGVLGTTNAQTLQLGSASTGDIQLKPGNNANSLYLASSGRVSIGNPALTTGVVNLVNNGLPTGDPTLVIQQGTGQTGDLMQFRNSLGNLIGKVDSSGNIAAPNFVDLAGTGPYLSFGGAATILDTRTGSNTGLVLKAGGTTQTGNLLEVQNNGGGVLSKFNGIGQLGLGAGTNSLLATLDARALSGTQPVASISGQTAQSSLVVDQSGTGDIFAASKSGATKFVINNAGNVRIANFTSTDGLITADVNGVLTQNANASLNSFGDLNTRYITTNATVEARTYQANENALIVNQGSTSPTAAAALIKGGTTPGATADLLQLQNSGSTTLARFNRNGQLVIQANGGTTPNASISGTTSFASQIVDQAGVGDIFTASKSGATKFTILNNGNLSMNNYNNCGMLTTTGTVLTCSSAPAGGTNYWNLASGTLAPVNTTLDLLVGGTASNSAKFAVLNMNSGTPTASISANSGGNATYLTGDGTLSTTLNKTLSLNPNGGNVGIGTTNATQKLTVNGRIRTDGGMVFSQGLAPTANFIYVGGDTAGATDQQFGFVLAGVGSTTTAQGGYFVGRGNNFSDILNQRGNMYFAAGNPSSPGALEGSLNFLTGNEVNRMMITNAGTIGVGTTSPLATLDVRGQSGTLPVASVSGLTAMAALVVNNNGIGDLFTASKSGSTKVAITNTGTLAVGSFTRASAATTPKDQLHLWGNGSLGSNAIIHFGDVANDSNAYIKEATTGDSDQLELGGRQGLIFATGTNTSYGFERMRIDASGNVAINNTGTAQATFDVRGISGTNPVASVSGTTSRAAMVVNNDGVGDLFTASKSGLPRFVIDNSGNVKIGTSVSGARLQVTGNSGYGVLLGAGAGGGNTIDGTLNGVANEALWLNSISEKDVYIVPNNGSVGVGTNDSSEGKLTVAGTYTNAASDYSGLFVNPTFSQTSNSSNAYYGTRTQALYGSAFNLAELDGAVNNSAFYGAGTLTILRGSYNQASISQGTTGTANYAQGVVGEVVHRGVGTIVEATGLVGTVSLQSSGTGNDGEITGAAGVIGYVQNNLSANTGTIGTGTAIYAGAPTASANAPITNTRGVYIENQGSAGVTNATGLYVEGQSGASGTNYAAIFASGRVGIGTTGPAAVLDVNGDIKASATITNTGSLAGLSMAVGNDSDADTLSALSIDVTSASTGDSDNVYGLNVGNLTGAGSTVNESGIRVGTGWDNDIEFSDSAPNIKLGATDNTSELTFTDASSNVLLRMRDMSTNFGAALYAGAFINFNSMVAEEFNRTRTSLSADTTGAQNGAFGNGGGWGVYEGGTTPNCTFSTLADTVNGITRMSANAAATGCMTMIDDSINNAKLMYNVSNLPIIVMKIRPSQADTTSGVYAGLGDSTDGAVAAPTNFIGFSNDNAGTLGNTWRGITRSGGTSTTVTCTGQTVSTTQFALLVIEVRSSTSVRFFMDNDVSNGVNLTECGSGSTTNIYTSNLAPQIHWQERSGGSASNLDLDFYRTWQDDAPMTDGLTASQPEALTFDAPASESATLDTHDVVLSTLTQDETSEGADIEDDTTGELLAGLDPLKGRVDELENKVASMEAKLNDVNIATPAAFTTVSVESSNSAETTELVKTDNLSVAGLATVSANLRVQGNGLIEGILNVVDTLTVSNFIVNKLATFFGDVVFHSDVIFKGTPYFNADTAGYVTIAKGSDKAEVKFTKPYKNEPVVNASVVTTKLSDDAFKKHVEENTCEADKGKDMCEQVATQEALEDSMPYIIASRSKEGFTILLSQPATQDLTFSWSALAVIQAEELVKGGDR